LRRWDNGPRWFIAVGDSVNPGKCTGMRCFFGRSIVGRARLTED